MEEIMSAYAIPGLRKIEIFDRLPEKSNKDAYIGINPQIGNISFSYRATELIELNAGDRVHFIVFGELIFLCKSKEVGTKVFKRGCTLSTQTKSFGAYIRNKLGARMHFKGFIKKTNHEFNGQALYELQLPYRYKRTFFLNTHNTKSKH